MSGRFLRDDSLKIIRARECEEIAASADNVIRVRQAAACGRDDTTQSSFALQQALLAHVAPVQGPLGVEAGNVEAGNQVTNPTRACAA